MSISNTIEVYLQSKYSTYMANGSTYLSDVYFYFSHPIVRPAGTDLKLRISNFCFPLSFYLVDSNSNKLVIGGSTYTLTSGNYTTSTLMSHILTLLPSSYSMSYSSITNKYTITNSSADFTLSSSSTCLTLLGFSSSSQTSSSKSLTSDLVCNLSGSYNVIYIDIPNISTSNLSATSGRQTSVVKSIPVEQTYGSMMYYTNQTNSYATVQEDTISFFHVRILGEDLSTLVNFNGQNWNMTLEFLITPNPDAPISFKDTLTQNGLIDLARVN